MAAPATGAALLNLVRGSALVDAARLDAYLAGPGAGGLSGDSGQAARRLIHDGILTRFQAGQLLRGRYKGFTLGNYKVLERLGASPNSNVYLCEHRSMSRRVAVKVLTAVRAADPGTLARFHREARAAATLDHPNIVHAYDSDQDGTLHFIVMEYVDGYSLQDIVARHGALDPRRAAHYVRQAAAGLQHVHDLGLVHRDVKPGNLLLDRGGVVRLLDLGLARFLHDHKDLLTLRYDANHILGTADYVSPEQARDSHDVDPRTDVYSLGATLYFLLSGRPPFGGKTLTQKLLAHQTKQPAPLPEINSDVPPRLASVVARMMAKQPAERFPAPAEVMAALAPWTAEAVAPPPAAEMPRLCPAAQPRGRGDTHRTRLRAAATPAAPTGPGARVGEAAAGAATGRTAARGGAGGAPDRPAALGARPAAVTGRRQWRRTAWAAALAAALSGATALLWLRLR
jgi:serine/threonine protein kinase